MAEAGYGVEHVHPPLDGEASPHYNELFLVGGPTCRSIISTARVAILWRSPNLWQLPYLRPEHRGYSLFLLFLP